MYAEHHRTAAQERAAIDAQFAGMENDAEAQAKAIVLAEESAAGSWESLLLSENDG